MRLLLIQICTVFPLAAFSQKISRDNKVVIDSFPTAITYSIQIQFSNGESAALGSSKVYIGAMFPQIDKLKIVKEKGDIVVKITSGDEIDVSLIRHLPEYSKMLANYQRIRPLPANSPSNTILYFRPVKITMETKDGEFYSFLSTGQLHSRTPDNRATTFGPNSMEKSNALSSLEFLRSHIFQLSGNQE